MLKFLFPSIPSQTTNNLGMRPFFHIKISVDLSLLKIRKELNHNLLFSMVMFSGAVIVRAAESTESSTCLLPAVSLKNLIGEVRFYQPKTSCCPKLHFFVPDGWDLGYGLYHHVEVGLFHTLSSPCKHVKSQMINLDFCICGHRALEKTLQFLIS